jgi:hypothetical protein
MLPLVPKEIGEKPMPGIEVEYDQKARVDAAHAEFTRKFGGIQTTVEGSSVFSGGAVATGYTLIAPQGFVNFLRARGISFRDSV